MINHGSYWNFSFSGFSSVRSPKLIWLFQFIAVVRLLSLSVPAAAQIYIALQPQVNGGDAPDSKIYESAAAGIYVQLRWDQIQPEPDEYDWRTIDRILDELPANKLLSISVVAGDYAPEWLNTTAGGHVPSVTMRIGRGLADSFGNRLCRDARLYLPWDVKFQNAYLRMMARFARHLAVRGVLDRVRVVKLTSIGRITSEMRMPVQNECNNNQEQIWIAAGYRPSKVLRSWLRVATVVGELFPDAKLAQDILEGNDFPMVTDNGTPESDAHLEIPGPQSAVKDRILGAGVSEFHDRFIIQWNSLTLNGRRSQVIPPYVELGAGMASQTNAFAGEFGTGCNPSRAHFIAFGLVPCTEDTYKTMLTHGINRGASHIEVWIADAIRWPGVIAQMQARYDAQ
jgi:hypothetical protein